MVNVLVPFLFLVLAIPVAGQRQNNRLGEIEFFGAQDIDVQKVRASLLLHEGEEFSLDSLPDLTSRIKQTVKVITGTEATDVARVCCDQHGDWMFYIGLQGKNYRSFHYNAVPTGSIRFPAEVVNLYRQAMNLLFESIQKHATEDRTHGYSLSRYPPLRAKQLAMREYAIHNAALIRRVLVQSAAAEQRTVAAELLGYAKPDKQQIKALVRASQDSNESVRNNAVRALAVLAGSKPSVANNISASRFVNMLNSGIWTDRNKGTYLVSVITVRRDPRLLKLLSGQASDSLLEMARWRDPGHADSARIILGRIAGIDEKQLQQLVAAHDVDAIIPAFLKKQR